MRKVDVMAGMFKTFRNFYRRIRDPWYRSSRALESRRALSDLCGRHAGEDMVIVATGPSLLKTDLEPFVHMSKIGLNRLYLAADELPVKTEYHIVANELLVSQFADDLMALDALKFLPWTCRRKIVSDPRTIFLNYADSIEFDPERILDRVPVGATVTIAALHLAYWLGAERVYLLGVDHYYALQDHEISLGPHEEVTRRGEDQNHIHPEYFGPGTRWQMPDLEMSEKAYLNARRYFEAHGRKILNATPGTRLEVFERIS